MTIGLTDSQYYSDIADAIRAKRTDLPSNTTFSPSQMAAAISGISGSGGNTPIPTPTPYHWVRPSEWPDLDSVYNGEKNTIWMTVDATGRFEYPCVSFTIVTNPTSEIATIQVGTITNGVFTATATETRLNNQYFAYEWTPSTGFYPVIKVTANGIKNIIFNTATTIVGTKEPYAHVIEWIGHADYAFTKTPLYVAHEAIGADLCPSNTFLYNRWQNCYRIESLDLSGWNTENWEITTLYQTWYYCYSLKELNLSGWDTTNWAVTSLNGTWSGCYNLTSLDLSGWDTSNWAVTSLNGTWSSCYSLTSLNISNWNTSNWEVTSLGNAWSGCPFLTSLDLSGWNTENWAVISIGGAWNSCRYLRELDLSGWDTTNWAVTNFSGTWSSCYALTDLNISNWDTTNWAVTNFSSTWNSCNHLTSLDLSNWDTTNWAVESINSTWNSCYSLTSLDLSNWDTTNWAVTTLVNAWSTCNSLTSLDLSNWDTTNWAVTSLSSTWGACHNLRELDLSNWDTTNWVVTNLNSAFNTNCLIDLKIPQNFFACYTGTSSINFYVNTLTRTSILSIFNALPTISSSKTISLGANNKNKMTAEEMAIATNKGWTVS